ncbi:MAG TPA: glycoside hydrolase family protein [Acidobacteriaceae bacterium]
MNDTLNKNLISGHEGLRLKRYPDTRGFWTIGRGFNLTAPAGPAVCLAAGVDYAAVMAGAPITLDQADAIFESQYEAVAAEARHAIPGIDAMPDNVGAVVCDMIFEMGLTGFLAFHLVILGLLARRWPEAIAGMKESKWATQVPSREENDVALLEALSA